MEGRAIKKGFKRLRWSLVRRRDLEELMLKQASDMVKTRNERTADEYGQE